MLGMSLLINQLEDEEREPEVKHYPYSFDLQMSFSEHELDTDSMVYRLQPYYAQLLCFHLGVETAYREKQKGERGWQVRYRFCRKNPKWNSNVLFGEPGWEPAVIEAPPSHWRSTHLVF